MAYIAGSSTIPQFFDGSGSPLSGGTVEFYLTGTTTATPVYSDSSGTSLGTSVSLNSRGEPQNSGGSIVHGPAPASSRQRLRFQQNCRQ